MDDQIIVKYVKIDGQNIENPLPRFEYDTRIGTWTIIVEVDQYADFFSARQEQKVEVEIGLQLGILFDVGKVKAWRSNLLDAPLFIAKVEGSDPMHFAER